MEIKLGLSSDAGWVLVMLAAAAVIGGCGADRLGGTGGTGGGASGGMGGTGGGEPLEMFASDFQTAFCAPLVACGAFTDLATCEAFEDFADGYDIRNIIASTHLGTVAYDPVAAAACIAALPQDCSVTQGDVDQGALSPGSAEWALQTISACISTFTGTVPLGGACRDNDFECAAPALCVGTDACTGTCVNVPANLPPGALGADCSQSGWCLLPAVCDGKTCNILADHLASCASVPCRHLDDYCGLAPGATTATCIPRLPAGSPCTLGSGTNSAPCAQDAQCVGDVCVPYAPLGGACGASGGQCLSNMFCTNGTCTTDTSSVGLCPIPM